MKIRDAKQSYAAHRHEIWEKREALAKILKEPGGSLPSSFDRVEISKELSLLDAQYDAVDKALMGITAMETKVFGDECNRHQAKMAEEMGKIMEVFRRVSSGAKVPAKDLQKLMDYDMKLYMAAKQAALLARQNEKEYDSLWEEEEKPREQKTCEEVAAETEISAPRPSAVSAAAPFKRASRRARSVSERAAFCWPRACCALASLSVGSCRMETSIWTATWSFRSTASANWRVRSRASFSAA